MRYFLEWWSTCGQHLTQQSPKQHLISPAFLDYPYSLWIHVSPSHVSPKRPLQIQRRHGPAQNCPRERSLSLGTLLLSEVKWMEPLWNSMKFMQYMSKFGVWINLPRSCEWLMACFDRLARATSREGSCSSPAWIPSAWAIPVPMWLRTMKRYACTPKHPQKANMPSRIRWKIRRQLPHLAGTISYLFGKAHSFYSLALVQLVFVHTCPIAYSYRVWVVWTSAKGPRNCDPHRTLRTSVWQFPAHWWSSWVSTFKQAAASSFWKHLYKSIMFQTLFCSIPSTFEKKQWTVNLELNKRNNDTVSKIILIPKCIMEFSGFLWIGFPSL